ncbi:RHS repeat-associated core domain-containing protein [Actinoallomurus sp. NPDC050550]|uniref:RHS repeat-associated core domain-containing protein n=1 Tax=Actinoallomurus sp. NPDC050550 TaxID=3154937 RepID=UPI0033EEF502
MATGQVLRTTRRTTRWAIPGVVATFAAALLPAAPVGARPASAKPAGAVGPVRYAHDAAGRLTGVSAAHGDTARYDYDASGNLTAIHRYPTSKTSVLSVVPERAAPGARVVITGTGFAASPKQNTVTFAGARAAVTAASASSLTVTVPRGAREGAVTVRAHGATATAYDRFTVAAVQPRPSVTKLSRTVGDRGDTVTITGSGFADAAHDVVTFGHTRARVASATSRTLRVTVPDAAGAGPVFVQTPGGTAASAQAFFPVPRTIFPKPGAYTAADVQSTGTITVNGASKRVSIGVGKIALLRFHAVRGQKLDLGITHSTIKTQLWAPAYDPYGAGFGREQYDRPPGYMYTREDGKPAFVEDFVPPGWFVGDAGYPFPQAVPVTGDYLLVLDPDGTGHGSATVTLSTRATGTIDIGGARTVRALRPGQFTELTFPATKNQPLSVGYSDPASGKDFGVFTRVTGPYGENVRDRVLLPAGSGGIPFIPHATGTHRLIVGPYRGETSSVRVRVARITQVGTLTVGGGTKVTADKPGQSSLLQFTGSPGDTLTLHVAGSTFARHPALTVYLPWGVSFAGGDGDQLVLPALPQPIPGYEKLPYEVVVDPRGTTGSATVTLTRSAAGAKPENSPATGARTNVAPRATATVAGGKPKTQEWQPAKASLSGGPWTTGWGRAPMDTPVSLQTAPGVTAVSGRALTLNGDPLPDVTLSVGDAHTTTGADGTFLLRGAPAGRQVLHIDGSSADRKGRSYGVFDEAVNLAPRTTTPLPQTIWMPLLDTAHEQRITSPASKETVLRTPRIPGLEVHIPKGTVIRDSSGKIVHKVGITAIPVDRTPFPLPKNSPVPIYYTIQPGGAYLFPSGARIIYPNYWHLWPGTRVPFTQYDPKGRGWYIYGHGTVTSDGTQVVPDKGVRVYQFTGAMILPPGGTGAPPGGPPQSPNPAGDGDPVDLATGLLIDQHTDLSLPDTQPIAVHRTYRQDDASIHAFGAGGNFDDGLYLWATGFDTQYNTAYLIRPDGGRVRFDLITTQAPPDVGLDQFETVVYRAAPGSGEFQNATMAWNGNGWTLRETKGTDLVFNDEGPLRAIRDPYGNTTTVTRDPAKIDTDGNRRERGATAQVTSPNGKWLAYTHENVGGDPDKWRITTAADNTGRIVRYAYNADGLLASVTNPRGGVTKNGYDAKGRLTSITDPRGTTYLRNTYDSAGRVAKQEAADGGTYTFAYSTSDKGDITATRVTDPRGHVRRVTFNADGAVTSDTSAYGTDQAQTVKLTLDPPTDRPTTITDALGHRTDLAYDADGDVTKITRLAGTANARATTFTYGPYDQPTSMTDPAGHTTRFTYGTQGDLRAMRDASGRTTRFTANAAGQVTSVTDGLGHTTRVAYTMGDPTAVTDPLGRTARMFTDAAGRVLFQTDLAGATTTSAYDAADHLVRLTDPLGHATSFGYDGNGNITLSTDPRGSVTRYAYDRTDRLTAQTDPLKRTTRYAYDRGGNLTKLTAASGRGTTYAYDALDRLVTTAYRGDGGTVTRGYDAGDRLIKVNDSRTGAITFAYDGLDRMTRTTSGQGTISYEYDAADQRTGMTVSGQPKITYSHDPAGDLTGVAQGDDKVGLRYDGAARLIAESLPGGVSQTYRYDSADQVTGIDYRHGNGSLGALAYGYDAGGSVAELSGSYARTTVPRSVQAGYDAADQLTQQGTTGFTYDRDGNLTRAGATSYTWDARGLLTVLKGQGRTASFRYDAFGRRIGKTVGDQATTYLYDGVNPVQEQTGGQAWNLLSGGIDQYYSRSAAEEDSGSSAKPEVYRPSDTYLTDALGSTVALTDDQGAVQSSYTYEPFGATTVRGDDNGNPFRFTGREDDETGLYYYRARYYSPADGRFTSADPLGMASGDTDLYTYVFDAPTDLTDPMGTKPDDTEPCTPNSLTDGTKILMADGTRKPIKEVRAGDKVRTVDPATGRTTARRVDTVITGEGTKRLVTITVATRHGTRSLTATDNHPFWVTDLGAWVDAARLRPGMWLQTASGARVQVSAIDVHTVRHAEVRNLTVAGTHTYFADAGGTDVLVHNQNELPEGSQPPDYIGQHENAYDLFNRAGRIPRIVEAISTGRSAYDSAGNFTSQLPDTATPFPKITATVKQLVRIGWGLRAAVKKYNSLAVQGKHVNTTGRGRHAKGNTPTGNQQEECGETE